MIQLKDNWLMFAGSEPFVSKQTHTYITAGVCFPG